MSAITETKAVRKTRSRAPATNGSDGAPYQIDRGFPHPLGATADENGVNFSVFSQNGTGVQLLLFDAHNAPDPIQVVNLDPRRHKTFHFWHVYVRGLKPGAHYAYRVDGPWDLWHGHRFNRNKVLIDPYAKGNTMTLWRRGSGCGPEDNVATSMRSVVIDTKRYDWEGDRPINRPMAETIVYEVHVGGFTRSHTAGVKNPGTFRGIVEKIPYLRVLGVTAVELMPVFE